MDVERALQDLQDSHENLLEEVRESAGAHEETRTMLHTQNEVLHELTTHLQSVKEDQDRYWTLISRIVIGLFTLLTGVLGAVGLYRGGLFT